MIAIVQRVLGASVEVDGQTISRIEHGLLALVAVTKSDGPEQIERMARKLAGLRVFRNGEKHFDRDVKEAGGSVLLVSNFTVSAETRHGRRPSFDAAADPASARPMFDALAEALGASGVPVKTGQFGADMRVHLVNDGPATFVVETPEK